MIGGGWIDNRPTHPNHKNGLYNTNNRCWLANGISQFHFDSREVEDNINKEYVCLDNTAAVPL